MIWIKCLPISDELIEAYIFIEINEENNNASNEDDHRDCGVIYFDWMF